jgi:excinuclease UvrABC nuclease subunit
MDITWSFFYMLTRENVRKYVPPSAGVYLLFAKPGCQTWMCYYAGQADDLGNRLSEHLSDVGPDPCLMQKMTASAFRFAEIEAKRDRNGVERFLYDRYKPECNKAVPGAAPIKVNLP